MSNFEKATFSNDKQNVQIRKNEEEFESLKKQTMLKTESQLRLEYLRQFFLKNGSVRCFVEVSCFLNQEMTKDELLELVKPKGEMSDEEDVEDGFPERFAQMINDKMKRVNFLVTLLGIYVNLGFTKNVDFISKKLTISIDLQT